MIHLQSIMQSKDKPELTICNDYMPFEDGWVELHLVWVFWLFPRTITAVDDGGNHFTTNVRDIFDPLVKANLKWQLECPALLITTPAIRWVAIEKCKKLCQFFFWKSVFFYHKNETICYVYTNKNVIFYVTSKFSKKSYSQFFFKLLMYIWSFHKMYR